MQTGSLVARLAGEPERPDDGWATRTVRAAMRRTQLLAFMGWNLLSALAALASAGHMHHAALTALLHLGLAGLSAMTARARLPVQLLAVANWLAFLWSWTAIHDESTPMYFGVLWLATLSASHCGFLLHGRSGILLPAAALVGVPAAMVWLEPDRDPMMAPLTFFFVTLVTFTASRVGLSYLLDFARSADRATEAAERDAHLLVQARAASRQSAEGARVLHDTVINTLAAIAHSRRPALDIDQVRSRCRQDVEAVEALMLGVDAETRWPEGLPLDTPDTRVVVSGLAADEVESALADLPATVASALRLATYEAARNAVKHSGAPRVDVRVERAPEGLTFTVRDEGRGFDGKPVPGHGLAESILARAAAADVAAEVDTATGAGTTVRLTYHWSGEDMPQFDADALSSGVGHRAALLWSGGLIFASIAVAAVHHGTTPSLVHLMIAVMALCHVVVRRVCGAGRPMPRWCTALLLVSVVATYLCAAGAVSFGLHEPELWQALGVTGPLVLLRAFGSGRAFVGGLVAVAALTAAVVAPLLAISLPAATVAVKAGGIGIGYPLGWSAFQMSVATIGARAGLAQTRAHADRVAASTTRAADAARRRWQDAGLHAALELLAGIGQGRIDPTDETVRSRAAEEESYLRQLTQLDADLVRLGYWMARALSRARERGVGLVLRTGGLDLPDREADAVGNLLMEAVAVAHASDTLVVTLFPAPEGMRVSLVAPAERLDALESAVAGWLPASAPRSQILGAQGIIEVLVVLASSAGAAEQEAIAS